MALGHVEDHALGQREKTRLESADHDLRLFDERSILSDEERVEDELAVQLLRRRDEPLGHEVGAALHLDDDVVFTEARDVLRGARELERRAAEKAMPLGRPPGDCAGEFERHDVIAEQGDEPAHRASESGISVRPAHGLAKRDLRAYPCERGGQECLRRTAFFESVRGDVRALRRLLHEQGVERDASLRRECLGRARRARSGVECDPSGRTEHDVGEVGLLQRDVVHHHREPPWGSFGAHDVVRETKLREPGADQIRQRFDCSADERRGELLDADLE